MNYEKVRAAPAFLAEIMHIRPTPGLAFVPIGVAIVLVMAVVGAMVASSVYNTAVQPSVTGTLTATQTASGPALTVSYANLGNLPTPLPPLEAPTLVVQGFPFSLGTASVAGAVSVSGSGTTIALPTPGSPSACTPRLTLSAPNRHGYADVSGAGLSGPATVSAIFGATADWPAAGYGLMISANYSSLFTLDTTGNGNTTATVLYEEYGGTGGTQPIARSSPFALDTNLPTEFTLTLSGPGGFSVSVNGAPRLNGTVKEFVPGYSPLAVWTTNLPSLLGLVSSAGGTTQWEGPTATCGFLVVAPIVTPEGALLAADLAGVQVVGPVPDPSMTSGSLFVLEAELGTSLAPTSVTIANCAPVSLEENGAFDFTAPWVG